MTVIAQGAEAVLTEKQPNMVLKERVAKGYRLPELDEQLRITRTALEARLLSAARRAGVNVPMVVESGKHTLLLEKIDGMRVTDILKTAEMSSTLGPLMGEQVKKLHTAQIAHGDLTSSNMVLDPAGKLWLIDFGLGKASASAEEMAADLYVFSESLKAIRAEIAWESFLKAYSHNNPFSGMVLQKCEKIASRRRYRGGL